MYFAQRYLVKVIKRIAPNVRTINYVTDGGPAHFKNRYNILNLTHHEIDFDVPTVWTFSATSHGKGPVDGLGAALKSTATRYLMRHGPEEAFKTPREFYDFSKQQQERARTPIELLYVDSHEITQLHQRRNVKRWLNTRGRSINACKSALVSLYSCRWDTLISSFQCDWCSFYTMPSHVEIRRVPYLQALIDDV